MHFDCPSEGCSGPPGSHERSDFHPCSASPTDLLDSSEVEEISAAAFEQETNSLLEGGLSVSAGFLDCVHR